MEMPKDNSSLGRKVALRRKVLAANLGIKPVVMETHGGSGEIWARVYQNVKQGVVFEKKEHLAERLAANRPNWTVMHGDCVSGVAHGCGSHLAITVLDIDPWGAPWPVVDAFFGSDRPFADQMIVMVNDGLLQKLQRGGAWQIDYLAPYVERYGTLGVQDHYLSIARSLLQERAAPVGYQVTAFAGYFCSKMNQLAHYYAILVLE